MRPRRARSAHTGVAARASVAAAGERRDSSIEPAAAPAAPAAAPPFAGDVLTDTRDVRACLPLDGGVVLAGTGGGLLLVRADGSTRAPWTALDGLPETRVHALLRDGERIWIGTEGGLAAARLRGERLVIERLIAAKPVRALALHDGEIVVATWGGGVARLATKDRLDPLRNTSRSTEARFAALAEHAGSLYAGAPTGLYRVADGEIAPVAGAPTSIWTLASHGERLWIGGVTGLASMARGRFQPESDADVRALAAGGDTLLAGTFGQGTLESPAAACARSRASGRRLSCSPPPRRAKRAARAAPRVSSCSAAPPHHGAPCASPSSPRMTSRPSRATASDSGSAPSIEGSRCSKGAASRASATRPSTTRSTPSRSSAPARACGSPPRAGWPSSSRAADGFRVTRYGEIDGLPSNDIHAVAALASGGVLVGTGRGAAMVGGGGRHALGGEAGIPSRRRVGGRRGPPAARCSSARAAGSSSARREPRRRRPRTARDPRPRPTRSRWAHASRWRPAISGTTGSPRSPSRGRTFYVGTYNAGVTALAMDDAGVRRGRRRQLGGGYVNLGRAAWRGRHALREHDERPARCAPADAAESADDWRHASRAALGQATSPASPPPARASG